MQVNFQGQPYGVANASNVTGHPPAFAQALQVQSSVAQLAAPLQADLFTKTSTSDILFGKDEERPTGNSNAAKKARQRANRAARGQHPTTSRSYEAQLRRAQRRTGLEAVRQDPNDKNK
ncbi:MAG: hypothetical protein VKJ04_05870 [Vampirovibrionales bacterium]|nr:hypothetical protein [Vampirovibrionales bacterium]